MDVLLTVVLLSLIGVCLIIFVDYMHHIAKMPYKRIAAIMSPVFILWAIMMYLAITY